MSIKHYKHVWSNYPEVKGSHKLVLLALAEFANEESNECWPSIARLSEMTGLKDRQVQNLLRELKTDGYIEIETNYGRNSTNVYKLTMTEKVQSTAPFNGEKKVQSSVKKVQSSTEKVQSSDVKGAVDCTRSVIEPIENQYTNVAEAADAVAAQPSALTEEPKAPTPSISVQANAVPLSKQYDNLLEELRTTKNRQAVLRRMYVMCFGEDNTTPDYGRLGRLANQIGGAGYLAQRMWDLSRDRPDGDILAYILQAHKNKQNNSNGYKQAQPSAIIAKVGELER